LFASQEYIEQTDSATHALRARLPNVKLAPEEEEEEEEEEVPPEEKTECSPR